MSFACPSFEPRYCHMFYGIWGSEGGAIQNISGAARTSLCGECVPEATPRIVFWSSHIARPAEPFSSVGVEIGGKKGNASFITTECGEAVAWEVMVAHLLVK